MVKLPYMIRNDVDNRMTRGSGNVFADLGFRPREASELQIKAELTRQIVNRIKQLGLTQVRASHCLGISQPDVSKLKGGRYTGYSTDRLIALLNALEVDVDIVVRPRKLGRSHRPGVVKVREMAAVVG
jgi:predicted XRE-type DNA-binding protein